MKILSLYIIFFLTVNSFAQNVIREFPNADYSKSLKSPIILAGEGGELLLFFQEEDSVFFSRSNDGGSNWIEKNFITTIINNDIDRKWFDGLKFDNGVIVLGVMAPNGALNAVMSADNGISWEIKNSGGGSTIRGFKLSQMNDSTVWLAMDYGRIYESNDYGESWNEKEWYKVGVTYRSFAAIDNKIIVVYNDNESNQLLSQISYNGGLEWSPEFQITDGDDYKYMPDIEKKGNTLYLTFISSSKEYSTTTLSTNPTKLKYVTSQDGIEWEDFTPITDYSGPNYKHNTSLVNGKLYTTFISNRFNIESIWYCKSENAIDEITPPFIAYVKSPKEVFNLNEALVLSEVYDDSWNLNVKLQYKRNSEEFVDLEMDPTINGYEVILPNIFNDESIFIRVKAEDCDSFVVYSELDTITYKGNIIFDKYLIGINKFKLPIDNKGVLADLRIQFPNYEIMDGGRFNEKVVLFSGGFALSGYNSQGTLWTNGSTPANILFDYLPGILDSVESGQDTVIYVLKKEDEPFGGSWQNWKEAVKYGAYFYDGDGDGKYNPIDKNENNLWDDDEDSPDILGDVTTWTVFNDGRDPSKRRFSNVSPQGIEVRQTVWAYNNAGALNNTIFVRYSLLNTGLVSDYHDSVYFSIWIDPDIGSDGSAYTDDLAGCDTSLNLGYSYNDGHDNDFGNNPPCLITKYLQGPIVESSDPESVVYSRRGILGIDSLRGYENLGLTTFSWHGSGLPGYDGANDEIQSRNYFRGRNQAGKLTDPCTFFLGEVLNYDCDLVDAKYAFSGDPVNRIGWLHTDPRDLRILSNTGPFRLEKGKPVDIIVAYIIGDGESALNSVTVGKEYAKQIQSFYENNFTHYVVSDVNEEETLIPTELSLSQNYPNPFNPTTVIEYSIPAKVKSEKAKGSFIPSGVEGERVQLKVYDVLGREVQTLVKKEHSPGNYKVIFPGHSGEGRNLSSGVYFYRLEYGTNIITRKMLLLK